MTILLQQTQHWLETHVDLMFSCKTWSVFRNI